ncbi:MAG TPA: cytochrome c oxidase assembly factor Coa1 family protein [Polyangiaceae bacterium]|nr:cytochrome c oxidase assembly factor Coa1 family protein [Polyangiaceae bacterium]
MKVRTFLLIFAGGFLSIGGLVGGILYYAFSHSDELVKSPGLDVALERARADRRIGELLGSPLESRGLRGGTKSHCNESEQLCNSTVDVTVQLVGPRGQAEFEVVGFALGKLPWEFAALELRQGDKTLNLLSAD